MKVIIPSLRTRDKIETGPISRAIHAERREEISRGFLDSWQSVSFESPRPPSLRSAVRRAADRMETDHLRAIERSAFGLLTSRRRGGTIEVRLFDREIALAFLEEEIFESDRCFERRRRIGLGLLARPQEPEQGRFAIGARIEAETESGLRWRLWSEVEGYPSRFLPKHPEAPGAAEPGWIARAYAGYHRRVTIGFLRETARLLTSGEFP
jgi:hypothetical protein